MPSPPYVSQLMKCPIDSFGSCKAEELVTPFAYSCTWGFSTKVLVDTSADLKLLLKQDLGVNAISMYDGETDTKECLNTVIDMAP